MAGRPPSATNLRRLRWAVQALARPAHEQLALYPDDTCKADELVLEFDEHARPLLSAQPPGGVTAPQLAALRELDACIEAMSGPGPNAASWTEEAVRTSRRWEEMRSLARAVLAAFGWPDACPPRERGDLYVRPPYS